MNQEQVLVEEREIEAMILPSFQTIQATYEALQDLCEEINSDGQAIMDTLQLASDILNIMAGSVDVGGSWLGPIALPIPLAIKAMSTTVSRYVERRTGISLRSWTEFVGSARAQFEDYLAQMGAVAELAPRGHKEALESGEIDVGRLRADRELLQETKLKTKLWRPVMGQVVQLKKLVDSMLEATKSMETTDEEPPSTQPTWRKSLKDRVGETVARVSQDHEERLTQLLAPVYDLKDKADQLGQQMDQLSNCIAWLEDLVDLEIAQISASLNEIPEDEGRILGQRVAVIITIPRLQKRLDSAQNELLRYQGYLQRLNELRQNEKVNESVYEALGREYGASVNQARTSVQTLEREVEIWRSQGMPILESGIEWLSAEIETVTARESVGQLPSHEAQRRRTALQGEIRRFDQACQTLCHE
jgi:hypothetical protein